MNVGTFKHTSEIYCVAFSPDGSLLALGGKQAPRITVWRDDGDEGEQWLALDGMTGEPQALAFSSDGRRLAAVTEMGAVWEWNLEAAGTPTLVKEASRKKAGIHHLAYLPEGPLATKHRLYEDSPTFALAPDGVRMAGYAGRSVVVSRRDSGEKIASVSLEHYPPSGEGVRHMAWSADSRMVAFLSDSFYGIWDAESGDLRLQPQPIIGVEGTLAFVPSQHVVSESCIELILGMGHSPYPGYLQLGGGPPRLTPWQEERQRLDARPPDTAPPKTEWKFNETGYGYEGVRIVNGSTLEWFEYSHNPHAGGYSREESVSEFLKNGPRFIKIPAEVLAELYAAIRRLGAK